MTPKIARGLLDVFALTAAAVLSLCAQEDVRVAVLGFEVQSDNPDCKYLGQGFAEFIAVELGSAQGVTTIEREERRDEVLTAFSEAVDAVGGVGNITRDENYFDVLGNPDEVYLASRANTLTGSVTLGTSGAPGGAERCWCRDPGTVP